MKSKYLLIFYFILLLVEIAAEVLFFYTNNPNLIYITKPLLMPILTVWAFLFADEQNITFNKTIIVALIFSLFGDIALMLLSNNPDLFIVGLTCFLFAHVIYITVLIKIPAQEQSFLKIKLYLALSIVVFGWLLVRYFYQQNHPEFLKLQIPVIFYAIVILSMLMAAISCFGKIPENSFKLLTTGSLLFVASDTTIALSKFTHLFDGKQNVSRIIIMGLYGTAQFLIIKGYISINKKSTIHTN